MRVILLAIAACSTSVTPAPAPAPAPTSVGPVTRSRIVAHRGGPISGLPENTIAAFQRAWQLGVECVELDVHVTKDGEVVVIHDDDLRRLGHRDVKVADATLAELVAIELLDPHDHATHEHIPTIAQALATIPKDRTLFVEIKTGPETAPAIARAILAADPRPRGAHVALQGIEPVALAALAKELPAMPAYWTAFPPVDENGDPQRYSDSVIDEAVRRGFPGVALFWGSMTTSVLAKAKAAGVAVDVWSINNRDKLGQWLTQTDVRWIETDMPELVDVAVR